VNTEPQRIKVLLADDHQIVRTGIATSLEKAGISVVGQAKTAEEVVAMYFDLKPDVVLLDVRFGDRMTGFDVAVDLLSKDPGARIVFCSQFDQHTLIKRSYDIGAFAFINKDCEESELADAVCHARDRNLYFQPLIADRMAKVHVQGDQTPFASLSERELDIVKLMAKGRTLAEIAEELSMSMKTVANASTTIKDKLGISRPAELTMLALRHNIIEL
jgi:two-component system invasion response regulator UvrY